MSLLGHLHASIHPSSPEQIIPFLRNGTVADTIDRGKIFKIPYDMILAVTARELARQIDSDNVGIFEVTRRLVGHATTIDSHMILKLDRSSEPVDDGRMNYYLRFADFEHPFTAIATKGYHAHRRIAAIGLFEILNQKTTT